jgi:hypothetical protein
MHLLSSEKEKTPLLTLELCLMRSLFNDHAFALETALFEVGRSLLYHIGALGPFLCAHLTLVISVSYIQAIR